MVAREDVAIHPQEHRERPVVAEEMREGLVDTTLDVIFKALPEKVLEEVHHHPTANSLEEEELVLVSQPRAGLAERPLVVQADVVATKHIQVERPAHPTQPQTSTISWKVDQEEQVVTLVGQTMDVVAVAAVAQVEY